MESKQTLSGDGNHDKLVEAIAKIGNQLVETIDKELKEINLLREAEYKNKIKDKNFTDTLIDVVESHELYVKNFFSVLVDNTDWKPTSHTECKFGKWYYSINEEDTKSKYGDKALTLFKQIGQSHKEFHEIGAKIIDYYRNNELKKVISNLTELLDKTIDIVYNCIALAQSI